MKPNILVILLNEIETPKGTHHNLEPFYFYYLLQPAKNISAKIFPWKISREIRDAIMYKELQQLTAKGTIMTQHNKYEQ